MSNTIGSNFDVATIVNELMKKEGQQLKRLNEAEKNQDIKLSYFGQIKNQIESLQKSVDQIATSFKTISYNAVVGDATVVNASVSSNDYVYPASHQLIVSQVAKAETLSSVTSFSSRTNALSVTGDLDFSAAGNDFTVEISATDTLDQIRDKINNKSTNHDVTASIVASSNLLGEDEYSLVISSNKSGLANKVVVSGSASAAFDFSNVISEAKDASFSIDGKAVVRATNEVNDVLDGVSISILKAGTSTINIVDNKSNHNEAVFKAVQDAVGAYNQMIGNIDQMVADRTVTDSSLDMIKTQLKKIVSATFEHVDGISNLHDIGIKLAKSTEIKSKSGMTFTSSGKLEIVESKLKNMIVAEPEKFQSFFTDKTVGFIKKTDEVIGKMTQFGGLIPNKTHWIEEELTRLNRKIGNEEGRLELVRAQLTAKYAALGAIMDQFDNMSHYLETQFDSMNMSLKK